MASLTIDFFHDVVCCWCFNISSRMRELAAEFDLDIRHRTFVLRAVRRDLSPHMMRDIGLVPSPDRPCLPFHALW